MFASPPPRHTACEGLIFHVEFEANGRVLATALESQNIMYLLPKMSRLILPASVVV